MTMGAANGAQAHRPSRGPTLRRPLHYKSAIPSHGGHETATSNDIAEFMSHDIAYLPHFLDYNLVSLIDNVHALQPFNPSTPCV